MVCVYEEFSNKIQSAQTEKFVLFFYRVKNMDEPSAKRPRLSSPPASSSSTNEKKEATAADLYLDTIDRHMLDFDFEKVCSVSLSQNNVYACLTCGKYYQGRGKSSHAYFHSMDKDHHVYINLHTLKVYVLPDGYEVDNASLNDIKVSDAILLIEKVD